MAKTSAPKYITGQRVEVRVIDFDTPGFPEVWAPGTVTEAELRDDGLTNVLVTRDSTTAGNNLTRTLVGKRGGGRSIRAL